jgi:hypothetical protein
VKPELIRRKEATEATLARFARKPFSWAEGRTCVHLLRQHLRNLGHRPPTIPRFRSALGAKKALHAGGWSDVAAMLDSLLPRIPAAAVTLGDIAALPGEGGLHGIVICIGNSRRVFGFAEGEDTPRMMEPNIETMIGAWRG